MTTEGAREADYAERDAAFKRWLDARPGLPADPAHMAWEGGWRARGEVERPAQEAQTDDVWGDGRCWVRQHYSDGMWGERCILPLHRGALHVHTIGIGEFFWSSSVADLAEQRADQRGGVGS